MSWLKKLTSGLKKSSQKISENITSVFKSKKIDLKSLEEVEDALILSDLGYTASKKISDQLKKHKWKDPIDEITINNILSKKLTEILKKIERPNILEMKTSSPHIILLVGVNGSGKTTTAAKLASSYKQKGKKVLLAAGDTFRAAAIEQLAEWGSKTNTSVVSEKVGADPAAVSYKAIKKAVDENFDIVILDTAGRLQNKRELMEELKKIDRTVKKLDSSAPHESIIVLDGTVGQNAISQVKIFNEYINLTGMVITKLDGSAKGGVVVALAEECSLPLYLVGVGESKDDLEHFKANEYISALLSK